MASRLRQSSWWLIGRVAVIVLMLSACTSTSGGFPAFPDLAGAIGWSSGDPVQGREFVPVSELRQQEAGEVGASASMVKVERPAENAASSGEDEMNWLRFFGLDEFFGPSSSPPEELEKTDLPRAVETAGSQEEVAEGTKPDGTGAPPGTASGTSNASVPGEPTVSTGQEPASTDPAPEADHEDGAEPPPLPLAASTLVEELPIWSARRGETLRQVLARWSEEAEWRLAWEARWDYPVRADALFEGAFVTAAGNAVRAFARVVPTPYADFYPDNRVVVVTAQETENVR